jgi:hypothetical protein
MNDEPKPKWTQPKDFAKQSEELPEITDPDFKKLHDELRDASAKRDRGALSTDQYEEICGDVGDRVLELVEERIEDEEDIDILNDLERMIEERFNVDPTVPQVVRDKIHKRTGEILGKS